MGKNPVENTQTEASKYHKCWSITRILAGSKFITCAFSFSFRKAERHAQSQNWSLLYKSNRFGFKNIAV